MYLEKANHDFPLRQADKLNPILLNSIMLYNLNKDGMYEQAVVKTDTGVVRSKLFLFAD